MKLKKWLKGIWSLVFPEKKTKDEYDCLETTTENYFGKLPEFSQEVRISEPKFEDYFNPKDFEVIERQKNASRYIFSIDKSNFISEMDVIGRFKNDFRKLALSKGFEARYSGKEKHFYLHKINYS